MAYDEVTAQLVRDNRELRSLLTEARAALEPLTTAQIKLHRIKLDLADRIDAAIGACRPAGVSEAPAPLTDEQIDKLWDEVKPQGDPTGRKFARVFARAVLTAHGVGEVPRG